MTGELQNQCKLLAWSTCFRVLTTTKLLLLWSLSNAVLASIILSGGQTTETFSSGATSRSGVYMLVVLGELVWHDTWLMWR